MIWIILGLMLYLMIGIAILFYIVHEDYYEDMPVYLWWIVVMVYPFLIVKDFRR